MAIVPIILDSRPKYLVDAGSRATLLSLPVGCGTLLDLVTSCLSVIEADAPHVVQPSDVSPQYSLMIKRHAGERASVMKPNDLSDVVEGLEPGDLLLFINPTYWPVGGLELDAVIASAREHRAAVHAVEGASSVDGVRESVRFDDERNVRSIRRLYDGVTWPCVGHVSFSVVPATVVQGAVPADLFELRQSLVARRIVTRDVPMSSSILDLSQRETMLTFAEQMQDDELSGRLPAGYSEFAPNVWVGRGVRIHPSARVIGPAILHHGAVVHEGATVIGPCTIGEGVIVQNDATIAQSVLADAVAIRAGDTLRHQILSGELRESVDSYLVSDSIDRMPWTMPEEKIADSIAVAQTAEHAQMNMALTLKRLLDLLGAFIGLLLFSPLMAMVAALIKLESRGKVLYGQEREGRNGRVFKCWKFRTMSEGAHALQRVMQEQNAMDGPQFKIANDPRVTRVGRWLRATNIDELPQLWNVLVGEMSLVGPRPSPFRENQICVPWRRARLSVRPGITGLWQVCRHNRSEGDFHQWIAYDTLYVRHHTFLLDVKILLATVFTLGGKWNVPLTWMLPNREAWSRHESPTPTVA